MSHDGAITKAVMEARHIISNAIEVERNADEAWERATSMGEAERHAAESHAAASRHHAAWDHLLKLAGQADLLLTSTTRLGRCDER